MVRGRYVTCEEKGCYVIQMPNIDLKYREVQLDLTPEIEVLHIPFERYCNNKKREIYRTAYKILQLPE